ncbi:MAG: hypothetical protein WC966_12050 [Bradymonadales bacterium]
MLEYHINAAQGALLEKGNDMSNMNRNARLDAFERDALPRKKNDMSIEIVNLTPHEISVVVIPGALSRELPPSGQVARVTETMEKIVPSPLGKGCPVFRATYGEVEGLPAPAPGVAYVVSGLVRAAVPNRKDVFSPGKLIRDENGQPIGCQGLIGN